jgi:hypothetical protein
MWNNALIKVAFFEAGTTMNDLPNSPYVMELTKYLWKFGCGLERFAYERGFYFPLLQEVNNTLRVLVCNGKLYYKATMYSPSLKLPDKTVPVSLREHVEKKHNNNISSFAEKHGDSETFIKHAIGQNALWQSREILLPLLLPAVHNAVSLKSHINDYYEGNDSSFARKHGRSQQQVFRWIKKNAVWCNGDIYLRKTEFDIIDPVGEVPKQALLLNEFIYNGLFLEFDDRNRIMALSEKEKNLEFRKAFANKTKLFPAQVARYLKYENTMWLQGEIYKKQTTFNES